MLITTTFAGRAEDRSADISPGHRAGSPNRWPDSHARRLRRTVDAEIRAKRGSLRSTNRRRRCTFAAVAEDRSRTTKVAIVGAGSVGATLAYACLVRGVAKTVALYDLAVDKVNAEVLDLRHGLQFVPRADVIGSDDVEVCAGADVVVVTAGAKQKPGQTR